MTTVAVIGCGRIANGAHFIALNNLEDVRIKYACDLIIEKAQKAKEKYPKIEQVITDYRIALADEEVEAVFVLTPNYTHYTVTMDALRAGKHVFCEKPITINYALSLEMAEEAKKRGLILNIGVCNRYQRSVEIIREMMDAGKFGKPYHVVCSFRQCRSIPGLGGAFTNKKESGGGVLIDWGIHFLDLILYVLGSPELQSVTCDTYSEMAKNIKEYKFKSMWAMDTMNLEGINDVDDFVTGYVRTSRATISFNGAWAQNLDESEMYVDFLGDKGGVRLDYCNQFTFFDAETLENERSSHEIPDMYTAEDRAFVECVRTGVHDKNNIENILNSMKLLDALYQSAEQHQEIRF